jgi:hypothetical protein
MEPTFKWEIKSVFCRPTFTDKYGNLRTDVIKTVVLVYIGIQGKKKEEYPLNASLSLIDLSNFVDKNDLSNEQILEMALSSQSPKQIEYIETLIKSKF